MKKSIKNLKEKLTEEQSEKLSGGFKSIKGGFDTLETSVSSNDTCTNSKSCVKTTDTHCTNSKTCGH